jgi:hypothetical protein
MDSFSYIENSDSNFIRKGAESNRNISLNPKKNFRETWIQGLNGNKNKVADLDDSDILYGFIKLIEDNERADNQRIMGIDPLLIPSQYDKDDPDVYEKYKKKYSKYKKRLESKIYDIIFIPIYNYFSAHWSLCVYKVKENKCYHYDSIISHGKSLNESAVSEKINFLSKLDIIKEHPEIILMENWYQQYQGWECGYYVLLCVFMTINMDIDSMEYVISNKSNHREMIYDLLKEFF